MKSIKDVYWYSVVFSVRLVSHSSAYYKSKYGQYEAMNLKITVKSSNVPRIMP